MSIDSSTPLKTGAWGELLSGKNGLRAIALCGGVAVHAINVYIVTTIMPSVVRDIGGIDYYAWITSLFVAASIIGSTLSASLIEQLGLRTAYLLGIFVFIIGSILAATAPSMPFLLFGRSIQGLGGGVMLGLSYASIRLIFEAHLWPRAMALISTMWGVSTLSGPAVGGLFAEHGAWRMALWSTVPVALFVAFLVFTQVPQRRTATHGVAKSDVPFLKILLLSFSVIVMSIGSLGQSWLIRIGALVGVAVILYGIAKSDLKSSKPLFPTGLYSFSHPVGALFAGVVLLSMGVTTEVFIPYFLENIHGLRPLLAGYMAASMSAAWTVGSIITAGKSSRIVNKLLLFSPLLSGSCLLLLGLLMPWQGLSHDWSLLWVLMIPLFGIGLGVGMSWPHILSRIMIAADKGQESQTTSAITTVQLYAVSLGTALGGMLVAIAGFNRGDLAGTQTASATLLIAFSVLPFVFVMVSKAARDRF
ncbi:MAG: MFS transporter [Alcaligenaceae bacterium]|nr:MFS transporter [Alcaligenaceae bacterium]